MADKQRQLTTEDRAKLIEGVKQYALANRSDPFALARGMAHVANGICGWVTDEKTGEQTLVGYEAHAHMEASGAITYRNVRRP